MLLARPEWSSSRPTSWTGAAPADSGLPTASIGSLQESPSYLARVPTADGKRLPRDGDRVVTAEDSELGDGPDRDKVPAVYAHEAMRRPALLDTRDRHPDEMRRAIDQVQAHIV